MSGRKKENSKNALIALAKQKGEAANDFQEEILEIVGEREPGEYYQMAQRVRWQQGLSERFLEGVKRSHLYLDHIRKIFQEEEVPIELSFLPHVESSFNYKAYSKVGAAGIWQFMRSTAKLFRLELTYLVDERLDPIKCARAAARLLKSNHKRLNSWPLALTAYNHGVRGLERAVKESGTSDIGEIVKNYKGRRFGFASRNFYASFLAAYHIANNAEKYFGEFETHEPISFSQIELPKSLLMDKVSEAASVSIPTIRELNPSLRHVVYKANLPLPEGFQLKVPKMDEVSLTSLASALEKLPEPSHELKSGGVHYVSRGETLYDISKIYRVSMSDIIVLNRISRPSHLQVGMKLKIPGKGDMDAFRTTVAKVKEKMPAKKIIELEVVTSEEELPDMSWMDIENLVRNYVVEKENFVLLGEDEEGVLPDDITQAYAFDVKKMADGVYRITVESNETLGHYADWLRIRTDSIRNLNNMGRSSSIRIGYSIDLPMSSTLVADFNSKRIQYHLAIEEDFYSNYEVEEFSEHKVRRGESINSIASKYDVPLWLLRKSQGKEWEPKLYVGQRVRVPVVKEAGSNATSPVIIDDESSGPDSEDS